MIYTLYNCLLFKKQSMFKIILACQNIHSSCFTPKSSLNGLRKMLAISRMLGLKKIQENKFVGG